MAGKRRQSTAATTATRPPCVGLVLGSGSARGWAHIGVIRALEEAGIRPDLVCGTSVGALVGAAYAAGELDKLEDWLRGLDVREVLSFVDVGLGGGMLKGERLMSFFRSFVDRTIEDLPMPFGAVATNLQNGQEVWLRRGSTVDAVRASIALPALFAPALHEGRWLVDGGLVNPVPVSLARAMGADVLIAVDLSADMVGRRLRDNDGNNVAPQEEDDDLNQPSTTETGQIGEWLRKLRSGLGLGSADDAPAEPAPPSLIDVMATSINIMQVRISRSRMAGEPPDVIIAPRLAHLNLLEFHRAAEAIAEGRRATEACLHSLRALPALNLRK